MGKREMRWNMPADSDLNKIAYLARKWSQDGTVLIDGAVAYQAQPGMALRDASCIVCLKPVGGEPFMLHTLVGPEQCARGGAHLYAFTVIRHVECRVIVDEDFADLIIAHLSCTGD